MTNIGSLSVERRCAGCERVVFDMRKSSPSSMSYGGSADTRTSPLQARTSASFRFQQSAQMRAWHSSTLIRSGLWFCMTIRRTESHSTAVRVSVPTDRTDTTSAPATILRAPRRSRKNHGERGFRRWAVCLRPCRAKLDAHRQMRCLRPVPRVQHRTWQALRRAEGTDHWNAPQAPVGVPGLEEDVALPRQAPPAHRRHPRRARGGR
jgi:hypothetical protein